MIKKKHDFKEWILRNRLLITIILFVIMFFAINGLRLSQSAQFPSQESSIFLNDFENYKSFNYSGTNIFYEIIIELGFIFGQEMATLFTFLIFGIINIILFDKINKIILKNNKTRFIANLLLLISNIFIVSFCTFSYLLLIMFFILWTIIYCFKKPKQIFIPIILSMLINATVFTFNLILAIIFIIILNIIGKNQQTKVKKSTFIKLNVMLPLIVFAIAYYFNLVLLNDVFLLKIPYSWWIIQSTTTYGIPLIYIALGLFALFTKIQNTKLTISILVLLVLSIFSIYLAFISIFIFIFLAAIGINYIISRKWFVKELKTPVIFLLTLLFLFNSLSFSETIITSGPNNKMIDDVRLLDNVTGNVFCDNKDCEIIELYSRVKVFYSNSEYENKAEHLNKLNITEKIIFNSNFKKMTDFFEENDITTVFISASTLNQRWTRIDRGLLFLLTQSNSFVKENQTQESLIFYYIKKESEE